MRLPVAAFWTLNLATPAAADVQPGDRIVLPLAQDWRFHQGAISGDVQADAFDDTGWQSIAVPHSWNRVGYYKPDPAIHVNRAETVNKYQGVAWYRLRFTPAESLAGRRSYLQFDAASRIATVWLNGVRLGSHNGGFSRFRLDATAALKPGKPNLLVVEVDNSKPEVGNSTADVLPLVGDFFVHGGLYRPVSLVATNPLHIDMLDSGGPGVYASTKSITASKATVDVRAHVRNDATHDATAIARFRLVDRNGATVAERHRAINVAAGQTADVSVSLNVQHPHLWQGTEDPYLYRLVAEVKRSDGTQLDRLDQNFGIRQLRFDPEKGFFLNGRKLRLHGVGYHQDREGKGWAVNAADVAADVRILRDMGANTIRLTHYQHGSEIHDLADRHGLILWDEIPLVSAWTLGGAKQARPGLVDNARQQLIELIRQNFNHPSVATWGIANEVDFGNSLPAFLTGSTDGVPPDPFPLLQTLRQLARAEDPIRPTALATCCEGRVFAAGVDVPTTAAAADLGGANRYFGWYFGVPDDLGSHLDLLRSRRPAQPLSVTEYGAGGATTIHTDNVLGGPIDARGHDQPEEYQSYIHEQNWKVLASKPYLWATWLWNAFDFATTVRTEGDAQDINTKGLVTYDRKTFKDAYFFYKANWTDAPTVHVNGRRYQERAYTVTEVSVYSNAASTELIVNDRSAGVMSGCPERKCVWPAVRLATGTNKIIARGHFGRGTVEDRIVWHVSPAARDATRIDSGAIVAAHASSGRFGSDAFFSGGAAATLDTGADYGKPAERRPIAGTEDRDVAATYRRGRFRYDVPLDNGRYEVRLTFVEPGDATAGKRRFSVFANGREVLHDLDIAQIAGAPQKAVTESIPVEVTTRRLSLAFTPSAGDAIVSAIEILRRY